VKKLSDPKDEGRSIKVSVEGGKAELERMKKRMEEIEEANNKKIAEMQKELDKSKADAEKAEKLEKTLKELAQKEYEEKSEEVKKTLEEKRELLGDEKVDELLEKLEDGGPEVLEKVMFITQSMTDALSIASDRVKKELEAAGITQKDLDKSKADKKKKPSTGVVSLLPTIRKGGEDIWTKEYEDAYEFVTDLYAAHRNETDPTKKARLNDAISELWRKLWEGEVKEYRRSGRSGINFQREFVLDPEARKILKRKGKL